MSITKIHGEILRASEEDVRASKTTIGASEGAGSLGWSQVVRGSSVGAGRASNNNIRELGEP